MPRRTNDELKELAQAAWRDLDAGERRSVLRHLSKRYDDPDLSAWAERILADSPSLSANEAYTQAARLRDVDEKAPTPEPAAASLPPEHPTTPRPGDSILDSLWRETPAGAPSPEDAPDVPGVEFLDDWPADMVRPRSSWTPVATLLRAHPGRPAIIRRGMPRKQAVELRRAMRHGSSRAFRPREAWRFEAAPDPAGHGLYMIVAAFRGES